MLGQVDHPHQTSFDVLGGGIGETLRIFAFLDAQIAVERLEQDAGFVGGIDAQQITHRGQVMPLTMLYPRRQHFCQRPQVQADGSWLGIRALKTARTGQVELEALKRLRQDLDHRMLGRFARRRFLKRHLHLGPDQLLIAGRGMDAVNVAVQLAVRALTAVLPVQIREHQPVQVMMECADPFVCGSRHWLEESGTRVQRKRDLTRQTARAPLPPFGVRRAAFDVRRFRNNAERRTTNTERRQFKISLRFAPCDPGVRR